MKSIGKPCPGKPYARFDKGGLVMASMAWLLRHRRTKVAETDRLILNAIGASTLPGPVTVNERVWVMRVFACMVFMMGFIMPASADDAGIHLIESAAFVASNSDLPPALDRHDWQAISLPDLWQKNHPDYNGSIWYRIALQMDAPPENLWAIYLPRVVMNAAVYVNGVMVGSGGRFTQPMARNWNRPLYFTVPKTQWKAGENLIFVHVQADKNFYGGLGSVQVGPDAQLSHSYQRALLLQIDVLKILFVLSLCFSAITFVFWLLRRRSESMYGWYALGTFLWPVYIQYFFVQDISVSAHSWVWLTFSSAYGMIISMMLFCQAFMQMRCNWCLKVIPVAGLAISAVLYMTPLESMLETIALSFAGLTLFVLFMTSHLIRYVYKHWNLETMLLGFGVLVNVALGIHDLLSLKMAWSSHVYLLHYGTPVMFLAMGTILVNRFLVVLKQSERLNLDLDQRVKQREKELIVLHEELRDAERKETILEERERMMEDLHDGMGGQLAAALSLLDKSKPNENVLLKQALKDAMLDFRLVIDSLDEDSRDVAMLLGMLRMRLEPQLQAEGICLQWHLEGSELNSFGPEMSLHILRIVQEAITNAIRHAGAGSIEVSIIASQGELNIKVSDDGTGIRGKKLGRGMANMHKRAARINAQLDIESSTQGVVVTLVCPSA